MSPKTSSTVIALATCFLLQAVFAQTVSMAASPASMPLALTGTQRITIIAPAHDTVPAPEPPDGFSLFPNPCTRGTTVTILCPSGKPSEIVLYSGGGSPIQHLKSLRLDTGTLEPGVYIVTVTIAGRLFTHKLLIRP